MDRQSNIGPINNDSLQNRHINSTQVQLDEKNSLNQHNGQSSSIMTQQNLPLRPTSSSSSSSAPSFTSGQSQGNQLHRSFSSRKSFTNSKTEQSSVTQLENIISASLQLRLSPQKVK